MLDSTTQSPMNCWTITATDDSVYEDDTEIVTLTLVITSQTGGVTLGEPRTTAVSVTDNDGIQLESICPLTSHDNHNLCT